MSSFGRALLREVRRLGRDPVAIVLIVAGPLVMLSLLAALFVREVPTELPVAVLDLDHSSASRRAARMLDASPTIATFAATDRAAAERALVAGEAYAVVELPAGLEHELKSGRAATVVCSYNAQLMLPSSLVRRAVKTVIATLSAGIELKMRTARGATRPEAVARFEPIRIDLHTLFNPRLSYVFFLLVALVPAMLQVFIVMASIWTTGVELRDKTAAEWTGSAGSARIALAAKGTPLVVAFSSLALAALALLFRTFDLPIALSGELFLAVVLFVVASCAAGIAIAVATCNLRFGLSVGAFVSGPAFAFAGITFPTVGMPPIARAWGSLLPLTHLLRVSTASSRGWSGGSTPFVAMALLAAGASLVAVILAPRIERSELWGRS